MFSASDVQKLRLATGAGLMECKRALTDATGDFDAAVSLIQERGLVKAEKKADRSAGSGLIHSYIHNSRVGVLLELNCETDFVARTEQFKELAHNIVMHVAAMKPADTNELLAQPYIKDPNSTVESVVKTAIAKLGENIKVGKFIRYEI
ncbi:MAG: translation elongation factor Ts [Candidatus Doudnabacteria bacterium RIFCSPHIGHO2_01_FULL_49_9]|uniref:Elongation factor Ts n=1 Tax=Candidatus Doudnabacteria bacterium RIFCSPHIGHO2_01_FULL_49_9 TaxID=1817827 RepID=A0A1F5NYI4_9BACT|nr:MAG: translation elongation factor Ts [Candidatus Doudnabacteria bacterium RIFCSPHIGHO2_01_FULL_49_9]